MDYNYITFKSLIFDSDFDDDNYKNYIEGKPKLIEIVSYGCHSTNNNSKKLVSIELRNFLPSNNYLYCHITDDNHFLTPCGLKFTNNTNNFNGMFDINIRDFETGLNINDAVFVLNLNLYY